MMLDTAVQTQVPLELLSILPGLYLSFEEKKKCVYLATQHKQIEYNKLQIDIIACDWQQRRVLSLSCLQWNDEHLVHM